MADQFIISSARIDKRKGNGPGYLIIKVLVKMTDAILEIKIEKKRGAEILLQFPAGNTNKKESETILYSSSSSALQFLCWYFSFVNFFCFNVLSFHSGTEFVAIPLIKP
jgi:hypothetical protein